MLSRVWWSVPRGSDVSLDGSRNIQSVGTDAVKGWGSVPRGSDIRALMGQVGLGIHVRNGSDLLSSLQLAVPVFNFHCVLSTCLKSILAPCPGFARRTLRFLQKNGNWVHGSWDYGTYWITVHQDTTEYHSRDSTQAQY
jgi:hypothetical protein